MSTPQTDKTGQIVPRTEEKKPGDKMAEIIQKMTPQIALALPKHMTGDRMARIVLTAIRINPELAECTQASFVGCVLSCAQLGLEPNTPLGLAYLIPRQNNKTGKKECTLQLGYQGMLELAGRAGVTVYGYLVRQGDDFRVKLGTDPSVDHVQSDAPDREAKPITHAYAVSVTPDGRKQFTVLSIAEINTRRDRSPAAKSGPWVTDYAAMCLKTAVRAHFRWMPKSTERIALATALDEAPEIGTSLLATMDPVIAEAMEREGLIEAEGVEKKNEDKN
jgi:recombination protein RecT